MMVVERKDETLHPKQKFNISHDHRVTLDLGFSKQSPSNYRWEVISAHLCIDFNDLKVYSYVFRVRESEYLIRFFVGLHPTEIWHI